MSDMTPQQITEKLYRRVSTLYEHGDVPRELRESMLEFFAAMEDHLEREQRRYLALPAWRKLLWRIGVWR